MQGGGGGLVEGGAHVGIVEGERLGVCRGHRFSAGEEVWRWGPLARVVLMSLHKTITRGQGLGA
jgi:hypothetical protein